MMIRQWFIVDREFVARRAAVLEAQEDAAIRGALDGAEGEERALVERALRFRNKHARGRWKMSRATE